MCNECKMPEPFLERGLPSATARVFAVNCFSISAINLFLLLPPFYGTALISNSICTIQKLCVIITSIQISLHYFRPNVPKVTKTSKITGKRKVYLFMKNIVLLGISVILYHIFAILYGAPFIQSAVETFHFSLVMTVLTTLTICLNVGAEMNVWYRIFLGAGRESILELYVQRISILTVIGAWFGAFVIPLDWDRPWQVWPIPCTIGALVGNSLGNSCMGFWLLYTEQNPRNKRRKKV